MRASLTLPWRAISLELFSLLREEQMQRLEELKAALGKELKEVERSGMVHDAPTSLDTYQAYLKALSANLDDATAEVGAEIIQRLVLRVEVGQDGFRVFYKIAWKQFPPLFGEPK